MYLVYLEHGVPYPIGGSNDPWHRRYQGRPILTRILEQQDTPESRCGTTILLFCLPLKSTIIWASNNLPTSTFPEVSVKIFYSSGRRPRGKTGYPIALLPTLLGSASAPSRLPRHHGAAALHFKEFLAPLWRYFRFLSSPSLSFPSWGMHFCLPCSHHTSARRAAIWGAYFVNYPHLKDRF